MRQGRSVRWNGCALQAIDRACTACARVAQDDAADRFASLRSAISLTAFRGWGSERRTLINYAVCFTAALLDVRPDRCSQSGRWLLSNTGKVMHRNSPVESGAAWRCVVWPVELPADAMKAATGPCPRVDHSTITRRAALDLAMVEIAGGILALAAVVVLGTAFGSF